MNYKYIQDNQYLIYGLVKCTKFKVAPPRRFWLKIRYCSALYGIGVRVLTCMSRLTMNPLPSGSPSWNSLCPMASMAASSFYERTAAVWSLWVHSPRAYVAVSRCRTVAAATHGSRSRAKLCVRRWAMGGGRRAAGVSPRSSSSVLARCRRHRNSKATLLRRSEREK